MTGRPQKKTALQAALEAFANPDNRADVLKVLHAVLSTAMVKSALEKGDAKSATKKAAKAECFAECIEMIEEELAMPISAMIHRKQTVLTTPGQMPIAPTTVIRKNGE